MLVGVGSLLTLGSSAQISQCNIFAVTNSTDMPGNSCYYQSYSSSVIKCQQLRTIRIGEAALKIIVMIKQKKGENVKH